MQLELVLGALLAAGSCTMQLELVWALGCPAGSSASNKPFLGICSTSTCLAGSARLGGQDCAMLHSMQLALVWASARLGWSCAIQLDLGSARLLLVSSATSSLTYWASARLGWSCAIQLDLDWVLLACSRKLGYYSSLTYWAFCSPRPRAAR